MKKNLTMPILCMLSFGIGVGVNNMALSDINNSKIAYVDVNKLLNASQTVKRANIARENQTKEMLKWYDNANIDIQSQATKEAKQELIKKYEAQLSQKKKTIKNLYDSDISKADIQIESAIAKKGRELGYTLIFKKDALLLGGDDITSHVLPDVK